MLKYFIPILSIAARFFLRSLIWEDLKFIEFRVKQQKKNISQRQAFHNAFKCVGSVYIYVCVVVTFCLFRYTRTLVRYLL